MFEDENHAFSRWMTDRRTISPSLSAERREVDRRDALAVVAARDNGGRGAGGGGANAVLRPLTFSGRDAATGPSRGGVVP